MREVKGQKRNAEDDFWVILFIEASKDKLEVFLHSYQSLIYCNTANSDSELLAKASHTLP